jgi:hypothetical protein
MSKKLRLHEKSASNIEDGVVEEDDKNSEDDRMEEESPAAEEKCADNKQDLEKGEGDEIDEKRPKQLMARPFGTMRGHTAF